MNDVRRAPPGTAVRIEVDPGKNLIAVALTEFGLPLDAAFDDEIVGTLDVGAGGRLIGIEIGDQYLAISDPVRGTEHLTRSVAVSCTVSKDLEGHAIAITFFRSGDGYEISFPSGNQCWRLGNHGSVASGAVCSVLIT